MIMRVRCDWTEIAAGLPRAQYIAGNVEKVLDCLKIRVVAISEVGSHFFFLVNGKT